MSSDVRSRQRAGVANAREGCRALHPLCRFIVGVPHEEVPNGDLECAKATNTVKGSAVHPPSLVQRSSALVVGHGHRDFAAAPRVGVLAGSSGRVPAAVESRLCAETDPTDKVEAGLSGDRSPEHG